MISLCLIKEKKKEKPLKYNEKIEKIFEKTLDTHGVVLYDKQASERTQSAMM